MREIRGDLVLDRAYFDPPRTDIGLAPFDETPEFRYNFIPDALSLNMNLVELQMASDRRPARIAAAPELDGVKFAPEFELVDRACDDREDGWIAPAVDTRRAGAITVRLRGNFPRRCAASTEINVIDRSVFAERLFRSAWKRLGGSLRGGVREGETPAGAEVLAVHRSRPFAALVRDFNKSSDNPVTRVVYLLIGNASATDAKLRTAERAEREVRAWLTRTGIGQEGLVLRAGLRSEWSAEFVSSLPVAALDGTMRRRLTESVAARRARIKTGSCAM